MRPARVVALMVTAGVAVAGCTTTVDGSAQSPGNSGRIVGIGREIAQILPTADDFVAALGTRLDDRGFPPTVGSVDVLPDGIRTADDASEIQCLTVTFPYTQKVFEDSSVRAVATHTWDNWDQGLTGSFSVDAGAMALANPADARALFAALATQWQQCQGKTMVLYHAAGGADQLLEITNVHTSDTMLSAVVMASSPATHTAPSPDERALGIGANCIVDVEVSDSSWRTGDPLPDNRAVTIAQAMLAKIGSTE